MFLFSCKEDDDEMKRSSEATMTTLTLTLEDTDYEITFTNKQDTITVPYNTKLPGEARVKAVELSAKATGVKVGETLTIPASEPLTITITAEDEKTTQEYTVTVKKKLAPIRISATEVAKVATTDVRDSYGIFNLKTNREEVKDYYIAVKEASATAPNKAEMENLALKRNVNTAGINVLIAQRLNAPVVAFAKNYFADNTKTTAPAGVTTFFGDGGGSFYDDKATGADALVSESVLKPSTSYNLYGMDGEGAVERLLTFSTDGNAVRGSTGVVVDSTEYIDKTLAQGHITLSIHPDETYILPTPLDVNTTTDVAGTQLWFNKQDGTNLIIRTFLGDVAAVPKGFENTLFLATNRRSSNAENLILGAYVILNTKRATSGDLEFGVTYSFSAVASPNIKKYSPLVHQK